jgi:hypothetical protein
MTVEKEIKEAHRRIEDELEKLANPIPEEELVGEQLIPLPGLREMPLG